MFHNKKILHTLYGALFGCFLLLFIACDNPDVSQTANKVTPITNPVMYKVTHSDKDSATFYVFGSIHVGDKNAPFEYPSILLDTYKEADELIFEADTKDTKAVQAAYTTVLTNNLIGPTKDTSGTQTKPGNTDDIPSYISTTFPKFEKGKTTLEEIIGAQFYKSLETFLRAKLPATSVETTVSQANALEPIYAYLSVGSLISDDSSSVEEGVDLYFLNKAEKDKKTPHYLETIQEQFELFYGINMYEQAALLTALIEAKIDNVAEDKRIYKNYLSSLTRTDYVTQNYTAFDSITVALKKYIPSYYDQLLEKRNTKWVTNINSTYKPTNKTYLVIVGALHLAGEDSIIKKLAATTGYTVKKLSPTIETVTP